MKLGKKIGTGYCATVYEWEEGKVIKLFRKDFPTSSVEHEYQNALAVRDLPFSKPKAYELITYEDQLGIIYDYMEGESLLDWVIRTRDIRQCAIYMAKLHQSILQNEAKEVSDYKGFLRHFLSMISDTEKREEVLKRLDRLPEGNTLCHGDFHPGNILLSGGDNAVIDFMNICRGPYLYDIARTVYLVQYTPVQEEGDLREYVLQFKKTLTDLYLMQMQVTRDMIEDYLYVIKEARKCECPDER